MSIIHAPEETPLDFRQLLIPGVIFLFLAVYFVRLWYLQVVISDDLKAEANRTGEISVAILAPRGKIVDRENRVLAGIQPRWVVTAIPRVVTKKDSKAIDHVAQLLEIDRKVIDKKLKDAEGAPDLPTVVYIGATIEQATRIAESDQLPGFGVETRTLRTVTDSTSFSHLLGYVGRPNATEEERLKDLGRTPAQYVGRDGIENFYEEDLMGVEGKERMIVDARRRPVRRLPGEAPIPGVSLELSLDLDLQKLAEDLLVHGGTGRGAVVAIDPRNGEILTMASAPTYNLADFEGGISKDQYKAYMEDEGKPFLKRAIAGEYSPGSTFKIVNAISAAIKGKLDLNHYVLCEGGTKIGNRFIKCTNHPRGSLSFYMAMTKSCNSYFIDLALKQEGGPLGDTAHELGLGKLTGVDIPGEQEAFCPTTPWINEQRAKQNWFIGHTANMGIGQGELRVTPIQMAQIVSLVANRGTAYKPHVVRAKLPPGEFAVRQPVEPEVVVKLDAPDDFWTTLTRALTNVVASGTAKGARIQGVEWAGKTGSTENTGPKTHAWFIGFAPAENPTIAIAVLVENAGHGGEIAAPIARQIVKKWLDKQDQKSSTAAANSSAADDAALAPTGSPIR
jgi:penicillin-binding protein 2